MKLHQPALPVVATLVVGAYGSQEDTVISSVGIGVFDDEEFAEADPRAKSVIIHDSSHTRSQTMTQRTDVINDPNNRTWITRKFGLWGVLAVAPVAAIIITMSALVGAAPPGGTGGKLLFEDARMIIEFNDTAQDVGVQMFIDGDPWKVLRVFDPNGKKILEITGTSSLKKQGLTELFFESSEPTLDEFSLQQFLARFPAGVYDLEGITIDGEAIEAEATFTHIVPDAPVIVSPLDGSVQNANNTVVDWLDVPNPPGSTIQSYQVLVTQLLDVLPKREFSVFVPASATSLTVPAAFMVPGAGYDLEVLAIEAGGNQTITTGSFTTSP